MSALDTYLVVGSGSIARRHIANLKTLFPTATIGCLSASGKVLHALDMGADVFYPDLKEALEYAPRFAIIATPAPFHVQHAITLLNRNVPVLIEKPLTDCLKRFKWVENAFDTHQHRIEIAYNLRYMPSAIWVKNYLDQQVLGKIHAVMIDVGQYLPDWRPNTDYRQNVSANKTLGGGVLLELSHELDYLTWFFGDFDNVFCLTHNTGVLDIDVEDVADALITRSDGLRVNIHLDFLQHKAFRTCKMIGELGTMTWDLLANRLVVCLKSSPEEVVFDDPTYDKNAMYLEELSRFAKVASGELMPAITLQQGVKVLGLIEAMKYSSTIKQMVSIGDFC
jgi:predicted dehydrogenase